MLSSNLWGPPIWCLLHTIVEKIKNDNFDSYKTNLINLIKNICISLPCPISCQTSKTFFASINTDKFTNLNDVKIMIYMLHNYVNKTYKKALFNYSDTKRYQDMDIKIVFSNVYNLYFNNLLIRQSINYNKMLLLMNDVNKFIVNNIYHVRPLVEPVIEAPVIEAPVIKEPIIEAPVIEAHVIQRPVIKEPIIKKEVEPVIEEPSGPKPRFSNNIYANISIIDDNNLPSFELTQAEAMIEIMKNPKCSPYKVYVSRWTELKTKYDKKNKINQINYISEKTLLPKADDSLLPPLDLTLPIAMVKIKENPKCVPFDLYVKRWNELKMITKHKKRFSK